MSERLIAMIKFDDGIDGGMIPCPSLVTSAKLVMQITDGIRTVEHTVEVDELTLERSG